MDIDEFYSAEFFEETAVTIWRRQNNHNTSHTFSRRFRAYFGTSSKVCYFSWMMVKDSVSLNSKTVHLLWALMFLKVFSTENVHANIMSVDEKTFRKLSWIFIKALSRLHLVSFCEFD